MCHLLIQQWHSMVVKCFLLAIKTNTKAYIKVIMYGCSMNLLAIYSTVAFLGVMYGCSMNLQAIYSTVAFLGVMYGCSMNLQAIYSTVAFLGATLVICGYEYIDQWPNVKYNFQSSQNLMVDVVFFIVQYYWIFL